MRFIKMLLRFSTKILMKLMTIFSMATQDAGHLTPTNIFINHLDTYISSHVGKLLLKSVFGPGAAPEEADEGLEEGSAIPTIPAGFNNKIFCTLSNPQTILDIPATVINVRRLNRTLLFN